MSHHHNKSCRCLDAQFSQQQDLADSYSCLIPLKLYILSIYIYIHTHIPFLTWQQLSSHSFIAKDNASQRPMLVRTCSGQPRLHGVPVTLQPSARCPATRPLLWAPNWLQQWSSDPISRCTFQTTQVTKPPPINIVNSKQASQGILQPTADNLLQHWSQAVSGGYTNSLRSWCHQDFLTTGV